MRQSRFTEEQIVAILNQAGNGVSNAFIESFNGRVPLDDIAFRVILFFGYCSLPYDRG